MPGTPRLAISAGPMLLLANFTQARSWPAPGSSVFGMRRIAKRSSRAPRHPLSPRFPIRHRLWCSRAAARPGELRRRYVDQQHGVRPNQPALRLITADGVRTYAALAERIRRFAFRRLGVGHGDRIAWLGENHPAFLEALFVAAGRIGAVLAPVNHYSRTTSVRPLSPTRIPSSSSSTPQCAKPRTAGRRCCTGSPWVARAPGR